VGAISRVPSTVPAAIGREYDELSKLDTATLKDQLTKALKLSAESLKRLATIVRLLEERGEDLSDLKLGLVGYLRQIAYGQLAPEAVVRFGQSPLVLRCVATLPMPDQMRLATGEPVELVVRTVGGTPTKRLADPAKLTRAQLHQVFARDRIRDEAEQLLMLSAAPEPRPLPVKVRGRITADPKRGGLKIGRTFVPAATLVEALGSLKDYEPGGENEPADQTVSCKLTEREHYRLKRAALDNGNIPLNTLIRRALLLSGLLSGPDPEEAR
jgi:hypothetical protein